MAPDLNAVASGNSRWDYSTPGLTGYNIPNITLNDPQNRKLRVITIGGGLSGILMAYQIQKYCMNVEHQIYEKNHDIGGTWLENRYPGAACDIPSHAYILNFAPNPEWPAFFSYSSDIWSYLDKICNTFDLRKYMQFDTEVVACDWQDDVGKWKVKLRSHVKGQEPREFEDTCDLLLHATGILNNFKMPNIPGMDKFKGRVVHTARWPEDYQAEQWKQECVAVMGSGASSIQTVPQMQKHVKHLDVFVRTGIWFVELAGHSGENVPYTEEKRQELKDDPSKLTAISKKIEDDVNHLWGAFYDNTEHQKQAQEICEKKIKDWFKDDRLVKGFTPKFGVGCRRITPGDPYMLAVQNDNVDVHFTGVDHFTEKGVVGADGIEREVDTVVCATGFDVTYRPRFSIRGKDGVDLTEKWKDTPESYLGLGCPDFPNWITFIGPTWPVENGSVTGPLLSVSEYAIQIIKKMQYENIKSWDPKQQVTDQYNEHCQEWIKHTVWKDSCRSWYKNNETGRVNAVYPGSSLHYICMIKQPRYEDMNIEYHNKRNMWAFMGMGVSAEHTRRGLAESIDKSPYVRQEYIDPKWLETFGHSKRDARKAVLDACAATARNDMEWEIEMQEKGEGGSPYHRIRGQSY